MLRELVLLVSASVLVLFVTLCNADTIGTACLSRVSTYGLGAATGQIRMGWALGAGSDAPKIFYRTCNRPDPAKPSLVFVHGVTGSSAWFQPQFDYFCARGYQVASVDNRGGGFSSDVGPYDVITYADDLYAVVHALKIRTPFMLTGWSYGGAVAQTYYNRHPEDVSLLGLTDTTCSYVQTTEFPFAIAPAFLATIIRLTAENYTREAINAINNRILFDRDPPAVSALREVGIAIALQSSNATSVGQYAAFPQFNNIDRLGNISVPTLIVFGSDDPIFRPAVHLFLRSRIPNSKLVELRGTGHSPFATMPARYNNELESFIKQSDISTVPTSAIPHPDDERATLGGAPCAH